MVQHTARRVRQVSLHSSVTLFRQVPRHASQGPAGTGGADESIQLATVSLVPDLRPSRGDVGTTVGSVVELVCPDGIVERFGVSAGLVVVVLRVVECDGYSMSSIPA